MGYSEEAEAYMNFIFERIAEWQASYDSRARQHLPLMFWIDGTHTLDEETLTHFGGYKDSTPVRIGNGASLHVQLDIYGELMDAIYLFNKHGKPITVSTSILYQLCLPELRFDVHRLVPSGHILGEGLFAGGGASKLQPNKLTELGSTINGSTSVSSSITLSTSTRNPT